MIDQVKTWRYRESNFSVNLGGGLLLGNCFQVTANYNIVCGRTADVTVGSAIDMVKDDLKKGEGNSVGSKGLNPNSKPSAADAFKKN